MLCHDTVAGVDFAPHKAEAGMADRIHRDRCMHHDPVGVAFLYRSQAAAALRGGGEFHLRGILDRQHMPAGDSRAGSQAPAVDDLRGCHFRIGEKPARLQFATTVTPQPAQAHRLARDHPFEDRTPLCRGADPRMIQATIPSRLLFSGCRNKSNPTRVASGKKFLRSIRYRMLLVRIP
jgi:hypothetical protein